MKIIFIFLILFMVACSREKLKEPKIFNCERILKITKISYEGILTFSDKENWELVEKNNGNIFRIQSGKFKLSTDGPYGSIIFDRLLTYFNILETPENTNWLEKPLLGLNEKLYFDTDSSLSWLLEPGYIFHLNPSTK